MSKLTLDQTIKHLEDDIPNIECKECREEHEQLLKWLKALKIVSEKVMPLVSLIEPKDNLGNGYYVYDSELYNRKELTKKEHKLLKEMNK